MPPSCGDRFLQFLVIQFAVSNVVQHVDRTQIANRCLFFRSVQQNFGAEVAAVNDATVILW